jgi:hypothetical protein
MTGKLFGGALAGLVLAWGVAVAADLTAPGAALVPSQPAAPAPAPAPPGPLADAAAPRPPVEEEEAGRGASPRMLGDLPGDYVLRIAFARATQTVSTTQLVTQTVIVNVVSEQVPVKVTFQVPVQQQRTVEVPVEVRVAAPFHGDFKVAEDESPRPEDRVYFNYNYYSDVTGPASAFGVGHTETVNTTLNGRPATVTTVIPGVAPPRTDLHREVAGFEKTFLGGDASIELRAPVVEQIGAEAIGGSDFGDMTVVLKYAFVNDRVSGDVLAAGLALTVPTGPGLPLPGGDTLRDTLIQPWGGYLWNFDRFYVEGFTSLVVPTDMRDVMLLFNDVGVGYALYRGGDGLITAVVPTLEAHVTTPLNHRNDPSAAVTVPDLVVLTAGSHFEIGRAATLSVGVAAPVTGPRAFDVEALVQLNYRF